MEAAGRERALFNKEIEDRKKKYMDLKEEINKKIMYLKAIRNQHSYTTVISLLN